MEIVSPRYGSDEALDEFLPRLDAVIAAAEGIEPDPHSPKLDEALLTSIFGERVAEPVFPGLRTRADKIREEAEAEGRIKHVSGPEPKTVRQRWFERYTVVGREMLKVIGINLS